MQMLELVRDGGAREGEFQVAMGNAAGAETAIRYVVFITEMVV